MDPVSVTALLISDFSIASNVVTLAKNLYQINDPKFTFVKISILNKGRTRNWFQAMGVSEESKIRRDLEKRIKSEDLDIVQSLFIDIKDMGQKTRAKFENVNLPEGKRMTVKTFTAR